MFVYGQEFRKQTQLISVYVVKIFGKIKQTSRNILRIMLLIKIYIFVKRITQTHDRKINRPLFQKRPQKFF